MARLSPDIRKLTDAIQDEAVRDFAIEIHKETGLKVLAPATWAKGAREAYEAAGGDAGLIGAAVAKLKRDNLTIGGPYSLVKTLNSLAAAKKAEAVEAQSSAATVQVDTKEGPYFMPAAQVRAFCEERGFPIPEGF